jgi:hypothetical protein
MMSENDLNEIYNSDDESTALESEAPATAYESKFEREFAAPKTSSLPFSFAAPSAFPSDGQATACDPMSRHEVTALSAGSLSCPAPVSHLSSATFDGRIPPFFHGSLTVPSLAANGMFHVAPPITDGPELIERVLHEDSKLTEHVMSLILAQIPALAANPVGLRFIVFRELMIMKSMNRTPPGLSPYIAGQSTAANKNVETSVLGSSNSRPFCSSEVAGASGFSGWNGLASIWSCQDNPTIKPANATEVQAPQSAPNTLQCMAAVNEACTAEGKENNSKSSSLASFGSTKRSMVGGIDTCDMATEKSDIKQHEMNPVWRQSTASVVSTASRPASAGSGPTSSVSVAAQSTVSKPTSAGASAGVPAGVPAPWSALTTCNGNSSERASKLSESTASSWMSSGADGWPGSKRLSPSRRSDVRLSCHSADTLDEFNLSGAPPSRTTTKRRESPNFVTGITVITIVVA